MGLCNDFDAKMWVVLVFDEIKIFGGQDVKNFRRKKFGRWWVDGHILKSTFDTVAGGGSSWGWGEVGSIGRYKKSIG